MSQLLTTPDGAARATVTRPAGRPRGLLCLGHGAAGGVDAADLVAVRDAAAAVGWVTALVEQPYRVAGRRTPPPAPRLDRAWAAAVALLSSEHGGPLVVGGRSSGARVACRTAAGSGAEGVLALAFPLRPPGRDADRSAELTGAGVPTLVVQGTRDPFGGPAGVPALPGVGVHAVEAADHSFRARKTDGRTTAECLAEVARVSADWLAALTAGARPRR